MVTCSCDGLYGRLTSMTLIIEPARDVRWFNGELLSLSKGNLAEDRVTCTKVEYMLSAFPRASLYFAVLYFTLLCVL